MDLQSLIILLVIQSFVCGFLSMSIAGHKSQSPGVWFASGFFLGIFGLIAAAGLPVNKGAESTSALTKKCPDCAEFVKKEASVCKHCGYRFAGNQVKISSPSPSIKNLNPEKSLSDDLKSSILNLDLSDYHNCENALNQLGYRVAKRDGAKWEITSNNSSLKIYKYSIDDLREFILTSIS